MLANYHTHTSRCHHAAGEDREYVEAAIRGDMKILGFSDHFPWKMKKGYVSSSRMELSLLDDYVDSIQSLKKEYLNDIKIYLGFESEYLPEYTEQQEQLLKDYPIDYMILGQHFLNPEPYGTYTGFPTEDKDLFLEYIDSAIEGMETGLYRYLAHPDLIHYTGDTAFYDKHMLRLCQYLKEKNIPVEINLSGVYENRHYTSKHFLKLAKQAGNSVILGVDAHSPERLEMTGVQEQCYQMARDAGLEIVTVLEGLE
ncbi:histidinol-phosphatase [[Clostridium] polysaccharolyticum]|uniref:Histidinol-phosphatase n=1 Tax=[Clostridium] polysaccharolyticum TaxID=29364 RepID=A0A1I0EH29_9FIRM|nr:histidinol-phosphatase [[Clostridium] polysaccharolyticum]SET44462.1 histidinol-phosphatase (PHP family) [[Clostridium] polysaccharolyticum]